MVNHLFNSLPNDIVSLSKSIDKVKTQINDTINKCYAVESHLSKDNKEIIEFISNRLERLTRQINDVSEEINDLSTKTSEYIKEANKFHETYY